MEKKGCAGQLYLVEPIFSRLAVACGGWEGFPSPHALNFQFFCERVKVQLYLLLFYSLLEGFVSGVVVGI